MPKAQLTLPLGVIGDKGKKLKVAAHFAGVALGKAIKIVDDINVSATYPDAQSLVKMCLLLSKVEGSELDSTEEEPKAAEPTKSVKSK